MTPPKVIRLPFYGNQSYVIGDVFEGGMGKVYKLYSVSNEESVIAMKTIKGKSSIELFDSECEAWLSISLHPNVAKAFAFGTWEGMPSVLIDWYSQSLNTIRADTLTYVMLVKLIVGTASALDFAFKYKGLIHQDIKPANILVDDDFNPKLGDFGLAKSMREEWKPKTDNPFGIQFKAETSISGTPFFMAPELWRGSRPSISTDIFSLGVTFFNLMTGEHPYVSVVDGRKSVSDTFRIDALERCLPRFDAEQKRQIVRFISKCLELNPVSRWQSYAQLLSHFGFSKISSFVDSWTVERAKSVVGVSEFYIGKGSVQEGKKVLESALERQPDDVLLLSALAKLHATIDQDEEAERLYEVAFESLNASNGFYMGEFSPKPAFDWSRNLILKRQYADASSVLRTAIKWEKIGQKTGSRSLFESARYPELGWHFLYDGEYEKACRYLIKYAQRCELDKPTTIWLIEAAWISGLLNDYADEIADKVIKINPSVVGEYGGEIEFVWSRVVLGQFVSKEFKSKLWTSTPSYLLRETSNLEREFGFEPGSLIIPSARELQVPFIVLMDKISTGGAHLEAIR